MPGQSSAAATASFETSVRVEAGPARTKRVALPLLAEPVPMGMHGEVAAHYRVAPGSYEPHPTTLDYVIGATTACLCGTLGGALAGLGQQIDAGHLVADGTGLLVDDRGTLRIDRIDITYRLRLSPGVDVDRVDRAHARHAERCPVARSISGCVDIRTHLTFVD